MAYLFSEILIISWHTEIWKGLCEKNQDNKIKDSGEAYDINWFTDVLTWFQSGKRAGLQHFRFIFSHLNQNIKFNYLQAG